MIPKKIFQTWENDKPPFKMSQAMESWKQKNPEWEYKLYTAEERVNFLKNNFNPSVLQAYHTLVPGAFKADLWRYCILYMYGGVYVDSDMICETPLDTWINSDLVVVRDDPMAEKWLANGFIASLPGRKELKYAIDKIVEHTISKKEMFYLDYTGPALWGKSVNAVNNRDIEQNYDLGIFNNILVLKHDYGKRKFTLGDTNILHTEYNEYRQEMQEIGNEPFFNFIQRKEVFSEIPKDIIWTTYDTLDINSYMVNSFKEKNPNWNIKYFSQKDVDNWFNSSIYNDAYLKLKERGERTDFFRYCYLFENGGVYVDADTYCNQPLDDWIKGQELIVGLEALVDKENNLGFDNIGVEVQDKIVSICNWAFATKPKHPVLSNIINDIINNPVNGVIQNTGPGRFSKWLVPFFGLNSDYTQKVYNGKSLCLPINGFGSNQSHSNSIKQNNPFIESNKDILITHMFAGTWRGNLQRKPIILTPREKHPSVSHNLTLFPYEDGFKGISRFDIDQERTHFMKKIGDCKTVKEYTFTKELTTIDSEVLPITGYSELAKFEDHRAFTYKGKIYYCSAYIDKDFNTNMCVLDEYYNFLGDIIIDEYNKTSFGVGPEVYFEKNWLFFEKDNELYFIYATTPNLIIYKCVDFDNLIFEKHSTEYTDNKHSFDKKEMYWTKKVSTGGSSAPIVINGDYVYLIHTKLYEERKYNHWLVRLDSNLKFKSISAKPFISKYTGYSLFFVMSMVDNGDSVILSGGVEDNQNFVWEIPKQYFSNF